MRTIEEIKGACVLVPGDKPDQEHWIWQGAYTTSANGKHRTAMCWAMDLEKDKMRTQSVSRAMYYMREGKALPRGKTMRNLCGVDGCVNDACWTPMSRAEHGAWLTKTGYLHTRHNYFESNRRTWDTRGRKVPVPVQIALASDTRKGKDIAAELGIDTSTANKYKRGTLGARARMGVFAGLVR